MLVDIAIENLGAIDSARAEFSPGLTVVTGETGAGKTMVVTGLRLLTGGRADPGRIRTGHKRAIVEGSFVTSDIDPALARGIGELVESVGGTPDDGGEVLVSRIVSTGRSRAHLAGRQVPAAMLKEFAEPLIAVHGQHDQLRLLSPEHQREALDRFDETIAPALEEYRAVYGEYQSLRREYETKTQSRRELAQEIDRLRFALDEIEAVDPHPGEDLEIIATIKRLQDVDDLREKATVALTCIDGDELGENPGAGGYVGEAAASLGSSEDEKLRELSEQLADLATQLRDISGELGTYLSDLDADPDMLEKLLTRQQELKGLFRKYAADADGVLAWKDAALRRLGEIDISAEGLQSLKAEVAAAEKKMRGAAQTLSGRRRAAAKRLSERITGELAGLAMPTARVDVALTSHEPKSHGCESVELLLAPTSGAEGRPLAQAASGGELSRVMLAIEVIVAASQPGGTLVFDEIDSGVGGKAAGEIGRRLALLARSHQVIVVTHLPQVAAFADSHIHVSKNVDSDGADVTVASGVSTLSDEERVAELARMLAGMEDSTSAKAHAAELLESAVAVKKEAGPANRITKKQM